MIAAVPIRRHTAAFSLNFMARPRSDEGMLIYDLNLMTELLASHVCGNEVRPNFEWHKTITSGDGVTSYIGLGVDDVDKFSTCLRPGHLTRTCPFLGLYNVSGHFTYRAENVIEKFLKWIRFRNEQVSLKFAQSQLGSQACE